MKTRAITIVVSTLLLTGCPENTSSSSGTVATSSATTTAAAPSGDTSAGQAPKAPTGVLSEDDFKKLHTLKTDDAPKPKGKMITLSPRQGAAEGGADSKAYLSLPTNGEPPLPSVVVIHEWWGLNQHIKHWSDRLAEAGYAALAVDLYGGEVATNPDDAMKLMKAVDPDAALATLRSAFAHLGDTEAIKATERASIGWCFGGKWSLELALAEPELDAAVVYYGHVETSPERLSKLEAPLLAIFGNEDKGIPPKMVDRFEFGLEQAGTKRYTVKRYDAQHAFANPSSDRYDQKAASAAWSEVRAFLDKELRQQ